MLPRLNIGTTLKEQYEIINVFGSGENTAAYLVADIFTQEQLLVWQSPEVFKLSSRPAGIREYFQQDGNHFLVLTIEGKTLSFMLTVAGRIDQVWAGLWMLQICRAIGYWHNRDTGSPLICLSQGPLILSTFRLTSSDQISIPTFGDLAQPPQPTLDADTYRFAAPETVLDAISPASDVYALGSVLYCILTGLPALEPEALRSRKEKLVPPRKVNQGILRELEKIVQKAMQLDPRKRYPTAAEMAAALEDVIVPLITEEAEPERKQSFLSKLVPLMISIIVLAVLFMIVQGLPAVNLGLKTPKLKGPVEPTSTPTPLVTPTYTPIPTPIPAAEVVLNQIRLDWFPEVIAYGSVLDTRKEPVTDLEKDQFVIRQDEAEIITFTVETVDAAKDPLSMAVVMDVSGSMLGEPLEKARLAAAAFVQRFDSADNVSLVKFDHELKLVHDYTVDKAAIIEAINSLRPRGDTALYDVIAYAVEQTSTQQGRQAVIILTDGRDTASTRHSLESAIAAANAGSIPIFVIGLDSDQFTPEVMEQIGLETGGEYLFAPNPDDLDALYQKIRGQLQNQYRLQFHSVHDSDGGVHTLYIAVKPEADQEIWGQKEYTSP